MGRRSSRDEDRYRMYSCNPGIWSNNLLWKMITRLQVISGNHLACLESSRTSILVNESPTSEFSVKRGLRQRDLLSPFLFILVMEGLHIALSEANRTCLIRGVKMGLKINIHKSNVYGVGVSEEEVSSMANHIGLPFTYLGLPIGSNMNHSSNWKILINRFQSRLSKWKANPLSIGGRLTLIMSVLESLDARYWSIANDGVFTVGITRKHLDDHFLPSSPTSTCWDKTIPRKVNIFLWRLKIDRLPHRLNLSSRGIEISYISCPSCSGYVESSLHIFFECDIANNIWRLVRSLCDNSIPLFTSMDH
nr:hypothetical protein [Tanacetum cinerariifolium]